MPQVLFNSGDADTDQATAVSALQARGLRAALRFAAIVEFGTGVVLLLAPALVVRLLMGVDGAGTVLGRCFGIALMALGLACWPARNGGHGNSYEPAWRGMLVYNLLITLLLASIGVFDRAGGLLLWPAVLLHAAVGLWLLWAAREGR